MLDSHLTNLVPSVYVSLIFNHEHQKAIAATPRCATVA